MAHEPACANRSPVCGTKCDSPNIEGEDRGRCLAADDDSGYRSEEANLVRARSQRRSNLAVLCRGSARVHRVADATENRYAARPVITRQAHDPCHVCRGYAPKP